MASQELPLPDNNLEHAFFSENQHGDHYLDDVNRNVFNQLGSAAVFRQEFGDRLFEEDTLHIIVGTDSGLLPRYLEKNELPPGSAYIFIELPDILNLLESEDRLPAAPQFHYTTPAEWAQVAGDAGLEQYLFIRRVEFIQSLGAQDAHVGAYLETTWQVSKALDQFRWSANASLGNETFYQRQLENLADNQVTAGRLKGRFKDKTAVLLAGGPSLDDLLPWVKEHRDRLFVLAVSRVARRLLETDVMPDIVFSIDPTDLSFDISREMLYLPETTLFMHQYHVHPALLAQWKGRAMCLGARVPWNSELNEPSLPTPGPTVTNVALGSATAMGFSQVILAGVDLCFSPEGYSHAQGSNERKAGPRIAKADQEVRTNSGELALTSTGFHNAITVLSQQASLASKHGCRFVNPSPNAAAIEGIDHVSSDDIELPPLDTVPEEYIDTLVSRPGREQRLEHYQNCQRELDKARHFIARIGRLADMAITYNRQFYLAEDAEERSRLKGKMDRVEDMLDKRFGDFSILTKKYGIRDFLKTVRPTLMEQEVSPEELEEIGETYYKAYREGSSRLVKLLDRSEGILNLRREEDAESPDLKSLADGWKEYDQPGRALVWEARHPDLVHALTTEQQARFDAIIEQFQERMSQEDTAHLQRAKRRSNLRAAKQRADLLFKRRDVDGLKSLRAMVENHSDDQDRDLHLSLIDGFICRLEDQPHASLEQFNWIVENTDDTGLLEEAFREIASVALFEKAPAVATQALQCLARLSPRYILPLAELQKETKQYRDAADNLADYLERFPQDRKALLQLADLYLTVDMPDAAQVMVDQLLSENPEDHSAQRIRERIAASAS